MFEKNSPTIAPNVLDVKKKINIFSLPIFQKTTQILKN